MFGFFCCACDKEKMANKRQHKKKLGRKVFAMFFCHASISDKRRLD